MLQHHHHHHHHHQQRASSSSAAGSSGGVSSSSSLLLDKYRLKYQQHQEQQQPQPPMYRWGGTDAGVGDGRSGRASTSSQQDSIFSPNINHNNNRKTNINHGSAAHHQYGGGGEHVMNNGNKDKNNDDILRMLEYRQRYTAEEEQRRGPGGRGGSMQQHQQKQYWSDVQQNAEPNVFFDGKTAEYRREEEDHHHDGQRYDHVDDHHYRYQQQHHHQHHPASSRSSSSGGDTFTGSGAFGRTGSSSNRGSAGGGFGALHGTARMNLFSARENYGYNRNILFIHPNTDHQNQNNDINNNNRPTAVAAVGSGGSVYSTASHHHHHHHVMGSGGRGGTPQINNKMDDEARKVASYKERVLASYHQNQKQKAAEKQKQEQNRTQGRHQMLQQQPFIGGGGDSGVGGVGSSGRISDGAADGRGMVGLVGEGNDQFEHHHTLRRLQQQQQDRIAPAPLSNPLHLQFQPVVTGAEQKHQQEGHEGPHHQHEQQRPYAPHQGEASSYTARNNNANMYIYNDMLGQSQHNDLDVVHRHANTTINSQRNGNGEGWNNRKDTTTRTDRGAVFMDDDTIWNRFSSSGSSPDEVDSDDRSSSLSGQNRSAFAPIRRIGSATGATGAGGMTKSAGNAGGGVVTTQRTAAAAGYRHQPPPINTEAVLKLDPLLRAGRKKPMTQLDLMLQQQENARRRQQEDGEGFGTMSPRFQGGLLRNGPSFGGFGGGGNLDFGGPEEKEVENPAVTELRQQAQATAPPFWGVTINRADAKVDNLWHDGPSYRAGIRPGDQIVRVKGIEVSNYDETLAVMQKTRVGEVNTITVLKPDGTRPQYQMIPLTVKKEYKDVPDIYYDTKQHYKIPETEESSQFRRMRRYYDHYQPGTKSDEELKKYVQACKGKYDKMWEHIEGKYGKESDVPVPMESSSGRQPAAASAAPSLSADHTFAQFSSSPSSANLQKSKSRHDMFDEEEQQQYERLKRFYGYYKPGEKSDDYLREAVVHSTGKYDKMWRHLTQKYGPEPKVEH